MNKDPSNSKIIHSSDLTANDVIKDEFDREYIVLLEEIENNLVNVSRHDLVRITAWIKKLNLITTNKEWKKNRNLHALYMLDMIINKCFEEPYNKFPPESHIPLLSKSVVKSKLNKKYSELLKVLHERFTCKSLFGLSVENDVADIKEEKKSTNKENSKLDKEILKKTENDTINKIQSQCNLSGVSEGINNVEDTNNNYEPKLTAKFVSDDKNLMSDCINTDKNNNENDRNSNKNNDNENLTDYLNESFEEFLKELNNIEPYERIKILSNVINDKVNEIDYINKEKYKLENMIRTALNEIKTLQDIKISNEDIKNNNDKILINNSIQHISSDINNINCNQQQLNELNNSNTNDQNFLPKDILKSESGSKSESIYDKLTNPKKTCFNKYLK